MVSMLLDEFSLSLEFVMLWPLLDLDLSSSWLEGFPYLFLELVSTWPSSLSCLLGLLQLLLLQVWKHLLNIDSFTSVSFIPMIYWYLLHFSCVCSCCSLGNWRCHLANSDKRPVWSSFCIRWRSCLLQLQTLGIYGLPLGFHHASLWGLRLPQVTSYHCLPQSRYGWILCCGIPWAQEGPRKKKWLKVN